MARILLLGGHTIQALPVMRSLKALSNEVIIECETMDSYGYHSRYPDVKLLKPRYKYDSPEYLDFVVDCIETYEVDIILPLFDPVAEFVSKNRKMLEKHVLLAMPPYDIFMEGYSKKLLMALCRDNEIPHPRTVGINIDSVVDACAYTGLPALIKPDITTGGRGMTLVHGENEIFSVLSDTVRDYGSCTLQEFIPAGGRQFKAHHFRALTGEYLASAVVEKLRYYPENGGSSCCNRTIEHPDIVSLTKKVLDILDWEGFADFDLIEDPRDGIIKIMEINPRFPACIKSVFKAGMDFAEIYINYCLGKAPKMYTCEPDVFVRYLGLDFLWFLRSADRFHASPSWFRFTGKNICYQEGGLDDPMPLIFGTYSGLKKLLDTSFRKSKAGLRHSTTP